VVQVNPGEVLSAIISGVAVLLLAWIARSVHEFSRDLRRFMAEHAWLIATTLWTRDKVLKIMETMGMPLDGDPPDDLPQRR
jgi:hypothetical protein